MQTRREQFRFMETNRMIVRELAGAGGRFDSVLEIGCGEGHQSAYLKELCDDFVGIDVVEPAVQRARERLPDAEFICGELAAQPWIGTRRFGLVTACEVLFYFPDVPAALTLMSRLGRNCIVTCFEPSLPFVEAALHAMPLMGRRRFRHRRTRWHAFWWRAA
jgi:predicted TPR repeat methyltransferase